jgi:hypothetical protein
MEDNINVDNSNIGRGNGKGVEMAQGLIHWPAVLKLWILLQLC